MASKRTTEVKSFGLLGEQKPRRRNKVKHLRHQKKLGPKSNMRNN